MKGYKSYKDSGVKFIGNIPSEWKTTKLKYYVNVVTGNTPSTIVADFFSDEKGTPWVKPSDLNGFSIITTSKQYLTEKGLSQSRLVRKGSVLIGGIGDIGKLGVAGCDITTNQQIHSVEGDIQKVDDEFLKYLLYFSTEELQKNSSSVVLSILTKTKLLDLDIVLPPLEEQYQIASFLDYKTNLIDVTIEKKKRLIELLKEKRQAVVNEAVTRGLDPNTPMKYSGVEWLGKIPEHWEVKKVKHLLNEENGIKIGPFGSALKLDTLTDNGIKVYGQGNVIKDDFTHGHRYIDIDRFEKDFKQYEILDGDILITMMGTTGKSKVFNSSFERGILDSHLLRLRFNEKIFDGRLFSILLEQSNYVYQQLTMNSVGSIMAGLNSSIVKELSIITPRLEIQKEILNYIDENCKIIDSISSKILLQIEKLQTYRQSLISEAVTGKIDVRDWQSTTKKA